MMVYYDSQETSDYGEKNGARLEHEKRRDPTHGRIPGRVRSERTGMWHLVRNEQAVNIDMLLVGELARVDGNRPAKKIGMGNRKIEIRE